MRAMRGLRRRRLTAASGLSGPLLLVLVALGGSAKAEGLWERARDARAGERASAQQRAEGYSIDADLRGLLAMLETARPFADANLKFVLGVVLSEKALGRQREAMALLRAAIEESPESPWLGRALMRLGELSAEQGDFQGQVDACTRALERLWQPRLRALLHYRRAEAFMAQGQLEYAISDYLRAVALGEAPELQAAAQVALAAALERSGDLASALRLAFAASLVALPHPYAGRRAIEVRLDTYPPSEQHYHEALVAMAEARLGEPAEARAAHLRAIYFLSLYVSRAPEGSPWLERARHHKAASERAIEGAQPRPRRPR